MKNYLTNIVTVCFFSGALFACSGTPSGENGNNGGGSSSNTNSLATDSYQLPISVDAVSYIPLFKGVDTNVGVYVRNDSNAQISNISYKLETNSDSNANPVRITNYSECNTIKAHGSCYLPLSIIGNHNFSQTRFSENLSVIYNDVEGKNRQFNNVLNFQYVDETSEGVYATPLALSNFGNNKNRGVVYVYATGKSGLIYNVTDLKLSNASLNIDSGNIIGHELASSQVQAIELSGSASQNQWGINTLSIAANSNATGKQYKSSAELTLKPRVAAEIYSGYVPLFESGASNSGKAYFQNTGSKVLLLGGVKTSQGIVVSNGANYCLVGQKLQPGEGCTVYYTVSATALQQKNGVGEIELNTNSNTLSGVASIAWYGDLKEAGAVVTTPSSGYWLGDGVQTTKAITLTNISESDIHDVTILQPSVSGNVSANIDNGTCGDTLLSGKSCTYYATIVANGVRLLPGHITYKYSANYGPGRPIKSRDQLSYLVYGTHPTLTINQDSNILDVSGNGADISVTHVTVSNSSVVAARISNIGLQNNSILTDEGGSCSNLTFLDAGASCSETIKLGPIARQDIESGIALYSVTGNFDQASSNIPYIITNPDNHITLSSITAAGQSKGDGSKGNPFVFLGNNSSSKSLTLNYTNKGKVTQVISSVANTTSSSFWQLDAANSSCLVSNAATNKQLNPGASCTIKFNNVFNLANDNFNAVTNSNLVLPQLNTLVGNAIITQQPQINGTGIIHTVNEQATVVNKVLITGNGSLKPIMHIEHTLTNANGYDKVSVTSVFKKDKFLDSLAQGDCHVSVSGSTLLSQCDLDVDKTVSETFPINIADLKYTSYQLGVNFNSNIVAPGTIGMNIWNDNYLINQVTYKGYYIVPNKQSTIGILPQVTLCGVNWDGFPSNCVNQTLDGDFPANVLFRGAAVYSQNLYILTGSSVTICPVSQVTMTVGKCKVQDISSQIANLGASQSTATILGDKFYWIAPVGNNSELLMCKINHDTGALEACNNNQQSLTTIYSYMVPDLVNNRAYILQSGGQYVLCQIDADSVLTNCSANDYPQGFPQLNSEAINATNIIFDGYLYDFGSSISISCGIGGDGKLAACKPILRPTPFATTMSGISLSDNNSGRIMFTNFYGSPTYLGTALLSDGDVTDWQNMGLFPNSGSYFGVYLGM